MLIPLAHGQALNDPHEIRARLEHDIDSDRRAGPCDGEVTTVIDLSVDAPRLVREGKGDIRPFGFVKEALHYGDPALLQTILIYAPPTISRSRCTRPRMVSSPGTGDTTAYILAASR